MLFIKHLTYIKKELDEDDGTLYGYKAAAPPSYNRKEAAPPPSPYAGRGGKAPPRETNDSSKSQRSKFYNLDAINTIDSLVQAPVTSDKHPLDEGNVKLPLGFPNKRARDNYIGDVGDVSDLGDISEDEEIKDEESEDKEIKDEEIKDEEIKDEEG
ncbi:hypothetical protein EsH8_XV_000047 [Colletotrichum jinshuiense]